MEIETLGFQNHVSLGVKLSKYISQNYVYVYNFAVIKKTNIQNDV